MITLARSAWHGGWLLPVILGLLVATTKSAQAQARITFEASALMPALADDRPAVTDWIASVHGANLAEGRMELRCVADNQTLGTVLTDELVLSGQEQKIRIVLPPMNWQANTAEIEVHLRWLGKEGVQLLPGQRLRTSLPNARKFPVLMGETRQRPRSTLGRDRLADHLRFESLIPDELKEQAATITHHQSADEFPQDPLAFCQYEVIAIAEDVFPALRSAQLDALVQWVRAGGSLYLEPKGVLEPYHVAVLNRLVQDEPNPPTFVLDEQGRLPPGMLSDHAGMLFVRCGLGVVVLHLAADGTPLSDAAWKQAAAKLWKFKPIYEDLVASGWSANRVDLPSLFSPPNDSDLAFWQQGPPLVEIMDALRPQGVKLVPLWVIGTLLGLLVLLIGPVDYVVLGWMHRRKWTWITFPACIVVMTGITIGLTNSYLSSSEARRALILHDVAADGRIVRTNRLELVFTSATRFLETDLQASLFTPLREGGEQMNPYLNQRQAAQLRSLNYAQGGMYSAGMMNPYALSHTAPVSITGRVPGRYTVSQKVNQWTPQLNRIFSIAANSDTPALDWDALRIPQNVDLNQWQQNVTERMALQTRVQATLGPGAHVGVISAGPMIWGLTYAESFDAHWQVILQRLTFADRYDLARLLSQTSPHGGRTLDDLSLGGDGSPEFRWLLVFVPEGDDLIVYRRPYAAAH